MWNGLIQQGLPHISSAADKIQAEALGMRELASGKSRIMQQTDQRV